MATGYEEKLYGDIARIADSLERIAKSLEEWDFELEIGGAPLERIASALGAKDQG
jgi:hypothetical protein